MKKYYVNGGIEIRTPFFKYANGGCGFDILPEYVLLPTTNKLPSGEEYLVIDDDNPQTMFAEYYARTFFTTGYIWAPLFHKTYEDDYLEFCERIQEARVFLKMSDEREDPKAADLILRHSYLIILCALDTFIADTVLTRITNDEETFYQFARKINYYKGCEDDIDKGKCGQVEQKVIEFVLTHSYLNKDTIKDTYRLLFGFPLTIGKGMKELFRQRHLIAHRGGRKKDGSYVKYTHKEIEDTISKVDSFAGTILRKIHTWEESA